MFVNLPGCVLNLAAVPAWFATAPVSMANGMIVLALLILVALALIGSCRSIGQNSIEKPSVSSLARSVSSTRARTYDLKGKRRKPLNSSLASTVRSVNTF